MFICVYSFYPMWLVTLEELLVILFKVADCICLMGLRMHSVVPIDTHILQITVENYLKTVPQKKFLRGKDRQQISMTSILRIFNLCGVFQIL